MKTLSLKTPAPKLKAGIIYSSDNGRLICLHCAGQSALYTGRDLSGHKVAPMDQTDADNWMQVMGVTLACECGATKHLPSSGVEYSEAAARAMFTSEPYLCAVSAATAIES